MNPRRISGWWLGVSLLVAFAVATLVTQAHYIGDTPDYVASIVAYAAGRDYWFWEFGHLLWRPLGWAMTVLWHPVTSRVVGPDFRINATLVLMAMSWIAGLLGVAALWATMTLLRWRREAIAVATVAFICSNGFLNYAQTGSSYVPGLAFLLISLYVLVKHAIAGSLIRGGILAGLGLAAAICMWFPYVLAVPAVLVAPLFLTDGWKQNWKMVVIAGVVFAGAAASAYLVVITTGLHISDIAGLRAWMAKTVGGGAQDKAVERMVFGFGRSFINMGNDGMLFKRYLARDPFNPVTSVDLFRLSLWKLGVFYLALGATVMGLTRSTEGRRVLGFFAVSAVPILALAVYWQGGDMERYFGLYPALMLSLGYALSTERVSAILKGAIVAFVVVMAVTNLTATSKVAMDAKEEATAARARSLLPVIEANTRIFTITFQDDLFNFSRTFPFHPINRTKQINCYAIVDVGTTQVPRWREDFATKVQETWNEDGTVWVSKRVLSPRPDSDWNWVEGDDRNVSWRDVNAFFSQLEMDRGIDGRDGFVLLPASERNRATLAAVAGLERKP